MAKKNELHRTWEWDGKKLKPKNGATSINTFERNNQPSAVIIGKIIGLY